MKYMPLVGYRINEFGFKMDNDKHTRYRAPKHGPHYCARCDAEFTCALTLRTHDFLRHGGEFPISREDTLDADQG
jgi:hypothetical protein